MFLLQNDESRKRQTNSPSGEMTKRAELARLNSNYLFCPRAILCWAIVVVTGNRSAIPKHDLADCDRDIRPSSSKLRANSATSTCCLFKCSRWGSNLQPSASEADALSN